MVYSEGSSKSSTPSASGVATVTKGATYALQIEVLRNDLADASEKVEAIRVDGVDIGECNPDGGDYDCTFFDCAAQIPAQNLEVVATSSSMHFEADLVGHSHGCDCDKTTWECSKEDTVSGRKAMTAVLRITLTLVAAPPSVSLHLAKLKSS